MRMLQSQTGIDDHRAQMHGTHFDPRVFTEENILRGQVRGVEGGRGGREELEKEEEGGKGGRGGEWKGKREFMFHIDQKSLGNCGKSN